MPIHDWTRVDAGIFHDFHRDWVQELEHALDRVVVRRGRDYRAVAVVEVVSAGNKHSRQSLDDFAREVGEFLARGVHVLLVELHPPTARDPEGIHGAVWGQVGNSACRPPEGKPLTPAAYRSGATTRAFVEPVAVGDALPDMPLYLRPGGYVDVPLEATYAATWGHVPLP